MSEKTKQQKRKANRRKTERQKRFTAALQEERIRQSVIAIRRQGAMAIGDVGACIGEPNARRLSAALRVARERGDVTFDGAKYGVPAAEPAKKAVPTRNEDVARPTLGTPTVPPWVQQDAPVLGIGEQRGKAGRLRRLGFGQWSVVDVTGAVVWAGNPDLIAARWSAIGEPTPAPGAARDLAERQAFAPRAPADPRTQREAYIRRILTAAGAREGTTDAPGLLVSHDAEGRVVLRWGMRRSEGGVVACSLTDSADAMMERAAYDLAKAGFRVTVGDDGGAGLRASASTLQSVDAPSGDERAPKLTEAAERVAALEARVTAYAATIVELTMRLIASEKARAA